MIKQLQDYRDKIVYNDWVQDAEDALRKKLYLFNE